MQDVVEMITGKQMVDLGDMGFKVDPLERLYELWPDIMEGENTAFPHLVGKARVGTGTLEEMELGVSLHSRRRELLFSDEGFVYFVIPVFPDEGVEGAYLRLMRSLGVL